MKIMSLNIFGGKWLEPLLLLLEGYRGEIDIFCFQEVFDTDTKRREIAWSARADIFKIIEKALPEFQGFFAPAESGYDYAGAVDFNLSFGLAMFVKKTIVVEQCADVEIFTKEMPAEHIYGSLSRKTLQYALVEDKGEMLFVGNVHGLWAKDTDKRDLHERIMQSWKIHSFMYYGIKCPKVLCGDFNLRPDTVSLKMLEIDMVNLIKKYEITSTRSSLYTKACKYADYILVSPDIPVKHFEVLQVEVSDHLPLVVEIE